MLEAKFICPECQAVIITRRPDDLLWERCPGCKSHVWDKYDVMMADVIRTEKYFFSRTRKHGRLQM